RGLARNQERLSDPRPAQDVRPRSAARTAGMFLRSQARGQDRRDRGLVGRLAASRFVSQSDRKREPRYCVAAGRRRLASQATGAYGSQQLGCFQRFRQANGEGSETAAVLRGQGESILGRRSALELVDLENALP